MLISTTDATPDPFAPIEGLSFTAYVAVCRALVRTAGDSAVRIDEVLATRSLTPELWDRVRAGWSERIRLHPTVRAEFRRLYAGAAAYAGRNE